jgi:hypothetical protein
MNSENCAVIGPAVMLYDKDKLLSFSDVILAGNAHKTHEMPYATVNSETRLQDMLNSPVFRNTTILAPDSLYRKYVFFEQIDCLPSLPAVKNTGKKTNELSEQSLALMLAQWMDKKHIYLFGYDIENLDERAVLLSIMGSNNFAHIYYVRKPNPSKIRLFDSYENVSVIDYKQFDKTRNAK